VDFIVIHLENCVKPGDRQQILHALARFSSFELPALVTACAKLDSASDTL